MMVRFSKILISAALVAAAGGGCSREARDDRIDERISVRAAAVVRRDVSLPIITSGVLSSEAEKSLSFKTGGIVREIAVDEGDVVRKGMVMAALDLSEIRAHAARARSAYEKAGRDHERMERLFADSVATLEQLQNAATGVEVASADLRVAEFNLEHSIISAPEDGRILKRFVEANELVSPGRPVFLFGSGGREWIVRVGVTDRDVVRLQLGDSATVLVDAYPGISFGAAVTEIAGFADPMTGTYEVELAVRPGGYRFVSGFVARTEIEPRLTESFTMIPIEALVEADGRNGFVFSPDAVRQTVKKIPVVIGEVFGAEIAVTGGLEGVDEVVTDGAPYLSDGSGIRIVSGGER